MSSRLYELVLLTLPRGFREEFGREMTQAFVDSRGPLLSNTAGVLVLAIRLRLDQLRVDLRHAIRGLKHQKTFTITAVTTLALALGPATAVFSLINGVLLDPLPKARNLDRVVFTWAANPQQNRHEYPWSELNFVDHRARKQGLSALAAITGTSATIGGTVPQQVNGAWVSTDMFEVLGIAPSRGRRFTEADMQPGAPPTIILGHDYAQTRFAGSDPIGQTLIIDGQPTAVIGVLPEGFRYPADDADFWQPLVIDRADSNRGQTYLRVLGRLADGATAAQVEQQMNAVAIDLEKLYPESNSGSRVEIVPATEQFTRGARRIVRVLGFAAIAIFLLACTNIASLLVVRTSGREKELSVRTALGASAARLSRQLLIEHLVLASVAGVAAIGVAAGLLRLVELTGLVPLHQIQRASLGPPAIVFLAVLMTLTAVSLGWLVSRRATRAAAISSGQRTQSSTREVVRLRQVLVSVEIGAAVVLLAAAGLLLQSAAKLNAVDPGFRSENVITFQVGLPMSRYMEPADRLRFIDGVVERLSQVPGVASAASGAYAPMTTMRATRRFAIEGEPLPAPGTEPLAIDLPAGPTYAAVMGLRLIDGRWISETDRLESPPVVVISESFAKRHFAGQRAIGRRLRYFSGRPTAPPPPSPEIVGVVSDVRQFGMAEAEAPQMYVPHAQRPWTFTSFFVKTASDPRAVFGSLRAAVHAVDAERPLERMRTLDELVRASTSDRRALSALLALAAVVALLISAIGVYGVTAATTAARKRELAIRAAIGADRGGLMRLVVRQGMVAAVAGIVVGMAGALAASSLLESVLYEVEARDPLTFGAVGVALLAVCVMATYLPARRALTISPAIALKEP
jgi:putative ABC transport system permease protein